MGRPRLCDVGELLRYPCAFTSCTVGALSSPPSTPSGTESPWKDIGAVNERLFGDDREYLAGPSPALNHYLPYD